MGAMTYRLLFLFALLTLVACKRNEVTSVLLSETDVVLSVGETVQLAAQVAATKDAAEFLPAWRSEDEAVATVTSGGLVTAVAPGDTYVTVTAGGVEARCRVGVKYFVQAVRQYMREPYSTGKSDLFTLCLATGGIDLADLTGTGEYLTLELFVPVDVRDSLPRGEYRMVTDFLPPAAKGPDAEYAKFVPYTLSPGFVMEGEHWGTWHVSRSAGTAWAFSSGTVEVDRPSPGQYVIRYDLQDAQGRSLAGVYEGGIEEVE